MAHARVAGAADDVVRRAVLDHRAAVHEDHTTRSATSRAKLISCVTTIIVLPSRAGPPITARTSPTSCGASTEAGSSNSITSGPVAGARAMATRCCRLLKSEDG